MALFFIILVIITFALTPLMVAGIFVSNQKKLNQIKYISEMVERGEPHYKGKELRALDDAYLLDEQIKATKDVKRGALASIYIRRLERLVNEKTS